MTDPAGAGGHCLRVATHDPSLTARVIVRTPLVHAEGADPALDRGPHVRAASSLAIVGDRLVVIQDDANFVAVLSPGDPRARSVTLPAGAGGLRQFDDTRGNKRFKLDLEASIAVVEPEGTTVFAFGSGSSAARERVVIIAGWDAGAMSIDVVEAPELYAALRAAPAFAGSELNLEGAALSGDDLWLFGRGNGAPRDGTRAANATCVVRWTEVRAYLRSGGAVAFPDLAQVTRYELGALDAVPLGFTDAATVPGGFLYSAAAEASPDAVRDGPVAGSCLGTIGLDSRVRWSRLTAADGGAFTGKVEGIAWTIGAPDRVIAVIDHDDPAVPSELCTIALDGPWIRW